MSDERYNEAINRIPARLEPERFRGVLDFYEGETLQEIQVDPNPTEDNHRIFWMIAMLRQVCFVRSFAHFRAALTAVIDDNFFAMTTLSRAHIETTGIMGHAFKILRSRSLGHQTDAQGRDGLEKLLFGTRHKSFQDKGIPTMVNIITSIQTADKELKKVMGGSVPETLLMDFYNNLSEFVHPNFHSNAIVTRPYKKSPSEIKEVDMDLLGALGISGHVFHKFYNALGPSAWQMTDQPN